MIRAKGRPSYFSSMLRRWPCMVLCLCLAVSGRAADPVIRQLSGPEGGPDVTCTVYKPQEPATGKPGLVVHLYGSGGSHEQGHYNVGRAPYDEFRCLLTERGYWLVVPDLGPRHWMNEAAINKVDAVINAMIDKEGVDADRVHLFGTSMGAGSSLIHAMRRPEKVSSVVAIFPMTDFARWLEEQPRYREPVEEAHGISPESRQQALEQISPIHNIAAFRDIPLYLLYGTQDSVVDPDHSRRFVKALRDKDYSIVYHEVEGETHRDEIARPYQRELADFLTKSAP